MFMDPFPFDVMNVPVHRSTTLHQARVREGVWSSFILRTKDICLLSKEIETSEYLRLCQFSCLMEKSETLMMFARSLR